MKSITKRRFLPMMSLLLLLFGGCAASEERPGGQVGPGTLDCCSGDPDGGADQPDQGALDAQLPDLQRDLSTGDPDLSVDQGIPGEFLDPCQQNQDCLSGLCITTDDGRVCSRPCNDDCPAGWECVLFAAGGADPTYLCLPVRKLCRPCGGPDECGASANLCLFLGDGSYCSRACQAAEDCPAEYVCREVDVEEDTTSRQCLPVSGWCVPCHDEDGDGQLGGPDCPRQIDCDDQDRTVYRDAPERCDGRDNDCDGETDEDFQLSVDPDHCGSCDRRCVFPFAQAACRQGECQLAGCDLDQSCREGFVCLDGSCCTAGHWNDNGRPEDGCEYPCTPSREGVEACDGVDNDCDGETDEEFDLTSHREHCGRCGLACPAATCVAEGAGFVARPAATCVDSRCVSGPPVPCGLYVCREPGAGEAAQCARSCRDDHQCVAGAHCEAGACVVDLADGEPCAENHQCASLHCDHGYCCADGDCCRVVADCPEGYAAPPVCRVPATCQGYRMEVVCGADFQCAAHPVDDDSACTPEILADDCDDYLPRYCTGGVEQEAPVCPDSCREHAECDLTAHCDEQCVPDVRDGESCDDDDACRSGHCQNGFCCAVGDCCRDAGDCPGEYQGGPSCDDPVTCQGHRQVALCSDEFTCALGPRVEDDQGCSPLILALDCGLYPDRYCTGQVEQAPPSCPITCQDDAECDPAAHCADGQCEVDRGPGGACRRTAECGGELICVDGVCCTSACQGLCQRCDLNGDGTCAPVAAGHDPDEECGGLACSGFYAGWDGPTCRHPADAGAEQVACDGQGRCQSAAEVCPGQPSGPTALTCAPPCQEPAAETCLGATAGSCRNLDGGNETCGVGTCTRTSPRCVNGQPNPCIPGPPGAEACNNLDDDCDGLTDEGIVAASDRYEPNNSCQAPRDLGTLAESGSAVSWSATIYPAGDEDWYEIYVEEDSAFCFPFDFEDFYLQVRVIPPQGVDCQDYDVVLYNESCSLLDNSDEYECAAEEILYYWGGSCMLNDDRSFRIKVSGFAGAAECVNYTLTLDAWSD